ncbi:MAG: cytochrome c3 family protein [Anaerolineaceae bacterium]|nr:cytochrome c3 family protein [Anaerolineaceae bacterium]
MKRINLLNVGRILLLLTAIILVFIIVGMLNTPEIVVAQSEDDPQPQIDTTSNLYCLSCHAEASNPVLLPSGESLLIQITMDEFANSTHDRNQIRCVQCHKDITGFPHPIKTAQTLHEFQLQRDTACVECHEVQANQTKDNIHGQLLSQGETNAPTCSNCHDPHTQPYVDELSKTEHSEVCANCHNGIYQEYAKSVHGNAMINENNQDVPGCIDCHGVHTIADPRTAAFRNSSVNMCANCHTDASIMDKYGISTQVLDTYVADFHGTTVTLFEKTEPDQVTNKAVCYDCHGIHNILSVNDPNKGLSVKQNMLIACQSCHPDATTNFPDTWLSHYIPDKDKYPIVYYVTLFYQLLIPGVLGGMAIFVFSDAYRRLRMKFIKPKPVEVAEEGEEVINHE